MKTYIYIICLLLITSCSQKPGDDFEYDFSITKSYHLNDVMHDSTIFYYDSDNKLIKSQQLSNTNSYSVSNASYEDDYIYYNSGSYYLDSLNRVIEVVNGNQRTSYEYENGQIVHTRSTFNMILIEEMFYYYEDSNAIKDSFIYYNQNDGEKYITVYDNKYTAESLPWFVKDFAFSLHEIPALHHDLLLEKENEKDGFKYLYEYDISENEVVKHERLYEEAIDSITENWTLRYSLAYPEVSTDN